MHHSVRIVVMDYYMCNPIPGLDVTYSEFRGSAVGQVPVLRCFGSTPEGKKICVHIHGVFPYFYIPYDGKERPQELMYQIASSLDKSVNVSFNHASSNSQHVYRICLVSGIPMYGYHAKKHQFLKLFLYNPMLMAKCANFLLNKHVLGQVFQPHETHLNFTLQFMIDYNLHGMNNMVFSAITYRNPKDKITTCELEGDILAENILNRQEVLRGNVAVNPGIEAIWEDEKQRRRNKEIDSQLGHFLEMENSDLPPTKTHLIYQQALRERLAITSVDLSTEQEASPDSSVYPAETPPDCQIQNASTVGACDLNTTCELDDTLTPSFDQEAEDFLHVLEQLAADIVKEEKENQQDEECVLSQLDVEDLQDESGEDLLDFTLPLDALTTPIKQEQPVPETSANYFQIPQIDGQHESSEDDDKLAPKVAARRKCGRSMPLLDDNVCSMAQPLRELRVRLIPFDSLALVPSNDPQKPHLTTPKVSAASTTKPFPKRRRFKRGESIEVTLRKISFRLARLERANNPLARKLKRYEALMRRKLQRCSHVKFNIVAGKKYAGQPFPFTDTFASSPPDHQVVSRKRTRLKCLHDSILTPQGKDPNNNSIKRNSSGFGSPTFSNSLRSVKTTSGSGDVKMAYNNCDGMADSSSEDEFKVETVKRRLHLNRRRSSCEGRAPQLPEDSLRDCEPSTSNDHRSFETTVHQEFIECKYTAAEQPKLVRAPSTLSSSPDLFSDSPDDSSATPVRKPGNALLRPLLKAPSRLTVLSTLDKYGIPRVLQQEPYYGNVADYSGPIEVGLKTLRVVSKTTAHLAEFQSTFDGLNRARKRFVEQVAGLQWNSNNAKSLKLAYSSNDTVLVTPVKRAPLAKHLKPLAPSMGDDVAPELDRQQYNRTIISVPQSPDNRDSDESLSLSFTQPPVSERHDSCRISGMTQRNTFGFDRSVQDLQAARAVARFQYLTTMVMEVHVRTRGDLKPDPRHDAICAVFYAISTDAPSDCANAKCARGVMAVNALPIDDDGDSQRYRTDFLNGLECDCKVTYARCEESLIKDLVELIKECDPDILAGYEIELLSWGYLVERSVALSINILPMISRSQVHKYGKSAKLNGLTSELDCNVTGRIVLNVWRLMRHEIALQSYTFESIAYHVLHRRLPYYPCKELTFWWDHNSNLYRHRVVGYYLQRAVTILELFDRLDFLNRTGELARLFGILFYEVLSRGSQFRVESMMLRLAKPLSYVPVSPDVKQRAHMKAPEFIPLVMEPESKLYTEPVIVLDFQSLYPSVMIAYNYCFTTCLGRVTNLGSDHPFEFGATHLKLSRKTVEKLLDKDLLHFSPCGVAFVKRQVREGILPRMLKEVLDTRLMVKSAMKEHKSDENLRKVLHNRQLGLKLIANVTYGYTAANFSGRMCCVEVGDSVVSKGRETLQRAIAMVEGTPKWAARVVYGDTDSLFVLVPGRTRQEAFRVGEEIAEAVTRDNPDPMKLKLEKVYQPCILQTKKRYVGYMYESPEQSKPIYEAKGIETVRRDGCPAVSKMLQKCLTILFETKNVSLIKSYVVQQFHKIQTGRVSVQDLTFAKEYRGGGGYKAGACVPALELARKWTAVDRRNEPRRGERVPYVIVNGPPGWPLIRLVRSPRDLLNDPALRPNALYYITKVIIPPLNRCFNLIGVDLTVWFNQMPRRHASFLPNSSPGVKSTIAQYFAAKICASCAQPSQGELCARCCRDVSATAVRLTEKLQQWERNHHDVSLICQSCIGRPGNIACASLDCPVLYRRTQTTNDMSQSVYVRDILKRNKIFQVKAVWE